MTRNVILKRQPPVRADLQLWVVERKECSIAGYHRLATIGKIQVVSHVVAEIGGCNGCHGHGCLRMKIYAEKSEMQNVLLINLKIGCAI